METMILIDEGALVERDYDLRFKKEALRSLIRLGDAGFSFAVIIKTERDAELLITFIREYLENESVNLKGIGFGKEVFNHQSLAGHQRLLIVNNEFCLLELVKYSEPLHDSNMLLLLECSSWKELSAFLLSSSSEVKHNRKTAETDIRIKLNVRGEGKSNIATGLGFFDHMLEQIAKHGGMNLDIFCEGDLHVDEHHTVEDTGIAFGEAFLLAIGDRRGMERYGFVLPMDEADACVLIDLGGRSWIVWEAEFRREKIGDMPTEMFFHFFKSFSDAAKCNLHIRCNGTNEHHKIEAIFKAFARALRMAVRKDPLSNYLPSTKGVF